MLVLLPRVMLLVVSLPKHNVCSVRVCHGRVLAMDDTGFPGVNSVLYTGTCSCCRCHAADAALPHWIEPRFVRFLDANAGFYTACRGAFGR